MDESPLVDKISPDTRSNIMENTTVNYFTDNWNREKLHYYLPNYIVEKILAIPILRTG